MSNIVVVVAVIYIVFAGLDWLAKRDRLPRFLRPVNAFLDRLYAPLERWENRHHEHDRKVAGQVAYLREMQDELHRIQVVRRWQDKQAAREWRTGRRR